MPTQMMSCPHCGTENSTKKRVCHHCQQELALPTEHDVRKRELRTREATVASPRETTVPRRETTARPSAKTRTTEGKTRPARGHAKSSVLLGATLHHRVQFYQQLGSLLRAGIPLALSLHHLERNIPAHLRPLARDLAQRVQGGGALSEAMALYPTIFPTWEVSLMHAAEKSGKLADGAHTIADTLNIEMDVRSRTASSTFYLKAVAVVLVLVMLIVRGLMAGMAQGQGGLAFVFHSLAASGREFALIAGAVALLWGLWQFAVRTRPGASLGFHVASRLPLLGPLMKTMLRLRFVQVLGALWDAGISPLEALELTARTTNTPHVIHQVKKYSAQISQGGTLSEVLRQTKILPPEAIYLIESGETAGTIPEALNQVAEYLRLDLDSQVKTLPAKAQLVMYAIVAPAVGYVVISFYMGYFKGLFDMLGF